MLSEVDKLKEKLVYNSQTGEFYWIKRNGKRAGCNLQTGYRILCFNGKCYLEHRLAWFYVYGEFPKQIDHIDGNRSNNRIDNLRLATHQENGQNKKHKFNSRSGLKGIAYCNHHKKWRAEIGSRNQRKHLGYFNAPEEAHAAYQQAALLLYGEFARVV